ncbi:GDSL-like Lipase/Acylhydrolase [Xylaria bambusicola]|uniref:GDSL-like Lipase/Acylhydrolase n=1 Tax=Xylaria bambusicola TaxID=326684 RepID=UPI00200837DD|nr:GDSL-like Lipase/Acylhydrolase [Xylaria bambusicola]KAI0526024.1 GDSL-like Lipase/Acylhydrolase [Xylaria bambusicola]
MSTPLHSIWAWMKKSLNNVSSPSKFYRNMTKPPLRILCFGNSLTRGYPVEHPYARKLASKIEQAFPGRKVEYVVDGLPGDLVTIGNYIPRMQSNWAEGKKPFDWTIVLGGTNDLGWGREADKIIEGLEKSWDIPLSKGGKVMALTIPETKGIFPDITEKRTIINDAIRIYDRENYFHFDLHKELPYHSLSPEDRAKYWNPDGVHLKAAGYDRMGEMIGDALVQILRLAEAQEDEISSVVSDARQRKAIEELVFEEEMGDPRLLSQGYIVVRKKDLN